MGNCAARLKKKRKGDSAVDDNGSKDTLKAAEDVTYAAIDHGSAEPSRRTRAPSPDDCDYATVHVPAALQADPGSTCSSKDECADDYVLMG